MIRKRSRRPACRLRCKKFLGRFRPARKRSFAVNIPIPPFRTNLLPYCPLPHHRQILSLDFVHLADGDNVVAKRGGMNVIKDL
jgi:hypothetical protein